MIISEDITIFASGDTNMMELIFIGTGNAFSETSDLPSAHLISSPDFKLLLDCGPSILPGLRRENIDPLNIDAIYISHVHPDHCLGINFLYLYYYHIDQPKKQINIYGPPSLQTRLMTMIEAMYYDEDISRFEEFFKFIPINSREIYSDNNLWIQTFPAIHKAEARIGHFKVKNVSFTYSGDTEILPELMKDLSQKSDFIIHEATSAALDIEGHTNFYDLFELDLDKDCVVYVTHHDRSVLETAELLGADKQYIVATDGMRIPIRGDEQSITAKSIQKNKEYGSNLN